MMAALYGISASELHEKVKLSIVSHLIHFERKELAERFAISCEVNGLEQALMAVMTRLMFEQKKPVAPVQP